MDRIKTIIFGSLLSASPWRIIKSILFIAVFSYLGLALYLFFFQHRLLYFPTFTVVSTPSDLGLEYEELWLPMDDRGTAVHGWVIPAGPENDSGCWIIFCHGNGGNIGDRLPLIRIFHRLGLSTVIFDYRGFGKSPGRPSEASTYEDVAAVWDWLVAGQGVSEESVIVFGRSLGGAIAAWLAAHRQPGPGLLAIESTFTSIVDVGRIFYPWFPVGWLTRHHYPTRSYVSLHPGPTLIMHSKDDEMIPMSMGRELYEAAPGRKLFIELEGGHNDVWFVMGDEYEELLRRGFAELLPGYTD